MKTKALKFLASEEKGKVSALLMRPEEAKALLVLGHGASSNMRHPFLTELSEALAGVGVATFRYQFPYMEAGGGGRNSNAVLLETVRSAVAVAAEVAPELSLFAGGHSMSGRMTSMAAAEAPLAKVRGIVFVAFPLHPSGKRGTDRAEHLKEVKVPMLFLSGTRDKLAELDLLEPVCKKLGRKAKLHLVDTADHGFKVLKRSRKSEEPVFKEMARVAAAWMKRKS
ncbi:MAG: dienelactone hydrolase family protein [bacterium]|nr:dienelactone hydrolase family protein [bacterium]